MNDTGAEERLDLSVVIITLNEERRLPRCLESLPRGAEIVVLDSGSTDGTRAIAAASGARVETRPFTDYADQKNAAVALAERGWILSIDADEALDDTLRDAIRDVSQPGSRVRETAFRVRRRLVFMGRAMRFGKTGDRPLRLFRRGGGRFESPIHERLVLDGGSTGVLPGRLDHCSYENIADYFQRFNSYTSRVAENHLDRRGPARPGPFHVIRPWAEFIKRYFFLLGFLDGYPGYCYALFSSFYSYVKSAKIRERCLASAAAGTPAPGPATGRRRDPTHRADM